MSRETIISPTCLYGAQSFQSTPEKIFTKVRRLIPAFFSVDFGKGVVDDQSWPDIIQILEIIQYEKVKFPYAVVFTYSDRKIGEVQIWRDPHRSNILDTQESLFSHDVESFASLSMVSSQPEIFLKRLHRSFNPDVFGKKQTNAVVARNSDPILLVGEANPRFFENNNGLVTLFVRAD